MTKRTPAQWLGKPWLSRHSLGQGSSFSGVVTAASFQAFPRFLPDATAPMAATSSATTVAAPSETPIGS